ncbi:MAG: 2-oxo acid dehydrogenase subunit E2 [Sphingomonadaceae bacterium]|jgi:2-oxoisovalerate dehydrogenase E2 component (dihydrolipoyl transacylase)|uniref:dihydrolipoamide acetyltransferase family protein n=1 Tax=Sphingorhabdus sp. TaxID=1902408 RepID=UPI002FDAB00A|nr:2-oxo acid dehydrogenase subunit E2 [Sphingomonadaceae bacterium]
MPKFTFNLPDIGEGIAEAEIVAWHVTVGDNVTEDQPLADMMTDKATVEMESPVSGVVTKVAGEAGDVIAIGAMLVEIEVVDDASHVMAAAEPMLAVVENENPHAPEPVVVAEVTPPPVAPTAVQCAAPSADKVTASPAVRQRANDLGVDLADVKAAGGHVRHADLDAFLTYGSQMGYRPAYANARRADEVVKVIGMRRRIADNMAASKRHIPHFTYVEEIDVTAIEAMRADLNANRGAKPKLTMLPMLIVAICKAIPQFPMINARFDDEAGVVTRHGAIHLGMATQTESGLMVPVIRDAQDRNIWQLATEIARLADAARSGSAKSEELSGSTLTITSLGPLGGIATTPVINRPEVAIIGPNKIVERPMFVGDTIEARKLMNLSMSCDHRVVDGWDAANYVQTLKKLMETPVLLFAD